MEPNKEEYKKIFIQELEERTQLETSKYKHKQLIDFLNETL